MLRKHATSGLIVRKFAEREGFEPARLYRWRERLGVRIEYHLAADAASMPERAAFVEVRAQRPSRIELVLREGHVECDGVVAGLWSYRTRSTPVRSADWWKYSSDQRVLSLPPSVRLFVATQAVDGRKGADSPMVLMLVRDVLRHDPLSGHCSSCFPNGATAYALRTGIATVSRDGGGQAQSSSSLTPWRMMSAYHLYRNVHETGEFNYQITSPCKP